MRFRCHLVIDFVVRSRSGIHLKVTRVGEALKSADLKKKKKKHKGGESETSNDGVFSGWDVRLVILFRIWILCSIVIGQNSFKADFSKRVPVNFKFRFLHLFA